MSKHIINIAADTSGLDPKIKAAIRQMREYEEGCRKAGGTLEYVDKEMLDLAKEMGNMTSKAATTMGQLKAMNTLLKEMEINFNRMTDAEKNGQYGKILAGNISRVRSQVNQLNSELNAVGLGGGCSGFSYIFGGNIAARAAMDGIRMVTSAMKNAVKVNIDFEQSNANLAAVLGTTRSEISALTSDAIRLGSESLYSAKDVTELQTVLARLGFTAEEIHNSTTAVLNLATATGTDLSKAADLAGSALRAFGLDSSEMERVASVLAVSTTKSALNTQKLSTSLGYAASVARQAGFSIEEVVAMLGRLVDTGMPATTAGVSVRNMLLDLSNESSNLAKNLGKPIRSLDDFMGALDDLNEKGLNTADVSNLVQKRVTNALTALAGNTDKVRQLRDEITDCGESMNKMAEEQASTLNGALTKLQNSWESLLISIGDGNTGGAGKILNWLDSVIDKLTEINRLRGGDTGRFVTEASPEVVNDRISGYKRRGMTAEQIVAEEVAYQSSQSASRDKWQNLLDKAIKSFNIASIKDELEAAGIAVVGRLRDDILRDLEKNVGYYQSNINMSKAVVGQVAVKSGSSGEGALDILTDRANKIEEITKHMEKLREILSDKSLDSNTRNWAKAELEKAQKSLDLLNGRVRVSADKAKAAKPFKMGDLLSMPAEGTLGYYEEQAKLVQNSMKYAQEGTDDYKEMKARLDEINKIIKEIKGETKEAFAEGSLGWLNQQLREANNLLNLIPVGTEEWYEQLKKVNELTEKINAANSLILKKTKGTKSSVAQWSEPLKQVESIWGGMSSGINSVTSAIDTMKESAEGNANAWEVMSSVIDATFGVMNSVVSVMQAVNTLQQLGIVLSKKQTTANTEEAASEGVKASAKGASSAAGAGDAVSDIPIVGPILAVAAIAAVAAAISSAFSKTEYHADGGFIGGGPKGSDVIPMWGTPGELVLNASQQKALAGQLKGGYGNLHIEKVIGAEEIRLILTNNNKRRHRSAVMI